MVKKIYIVVLHRNGWGEIASSRQHQCCVSLQHQYNELEYLSGRAQNLPMTPWTPASRTACRSSQGRPGSWWWMSLNQWTSRKWTLRQWTLRSTWVFTWTKNWTGQIISLHCTRKARLYLLRRLRFIGMQGAFFSHCCGNSHFLWSGLLG